MPVKSKSLCDSCYSPGNCCKNIKLFTDKSEHKTIWLDQSIEEQLAVPFEMQRLTQFYRDEESGREYGVLEYSCPWLTREGRCGNYENRPELCKIFEPGSDYICVHYRGAEGGDPTFSGVITL